MTGSRRSRGAAASARAVLLALALGCLALAAPGARAAEGPLEQQVKAAYLYQFAGYVEWPPEVFGKGDAPFTIAVIGDDVIEGELRTVTSGRQVSGRPIEIRRLAPGDPLDGVHILFIGRAERGRAPELARRAQSRGVLAVTEWDGALDQGSMINFVLVDRRVRFQVGLDAAEKGGLKVSSRLLAVAEQVRREEP